ncbi:hypothetical protein L202_06998 [Cryptococcus amylolentus CBS 6039]|uniref:HAT C-terminal dimerisation domain-containing protein n=1 Tax=Cryptococcus amylolentus CBS 6039 TaxID=1295533 RepID=A0A1E3HE94_9TREE|nr:hypothetical protein L202_06998 [Cryptococcus amylolentus CBS 6039]ODN74658.1 hypothetical protein L202_06998 [Cryptococcus amylolentus CBS 6039]
MSHLLKYKEGCKAQNIDMATRVAEKLDKEMGVVQEDKGTDKQQSIAQFTKPQYSMADCLKAALDCLIALNLPITTVDRPDFRRLMLVCGNGQLQDGDIYPQTRATSMIEDCADIAIQELKALLKNAHAKKSITWDLWTSADCTSFVAVTVHWVTNKFKITSDLLEFKEVKSAHTGSNLAELLYQLVKEYDIAKSVERMDVGKLLAKIRQLIVKVRGSPNAGQYFQKCCVEANTRQLVLLPFCKTRWGSMCTVIERVLVLRPAINQFTSTSDTACNVPKAGPKRQMYCDFTISDCEYQVLGMLRKVMRPGVDIQQIFGAQDHPSIGLVMIELSKLLKTWEQMSESFNNSIIQPAIQAGIDSIKKYYKNAIIAGVPVFALCKSQGKGYMLTVLFLSIQSYTLLLRTSSPWFISVMKRTRSCLRLSKKRYGGPGRSRVETVQWQRLTTKQQFCRYRKIYTTTSTTSSPALPTIDMDLPAMSASEMKMHKMKMERKRRAEELARLEAGDPELTKLTDYFKTLEEEPVVLKGVNRHQFVSEWTLTWWYKKQMIYPVLSKMARDIWGVQASLVPCERMFSQAGLADTKRRQSMTLKHFGQLQRLQAHAKVVKEVATKRSA